MSEKPGIYILLVLSASALLCTEPAQAQKIITLTAEAEVRLESTSTPKQAEEQALRDAWGDAVRRASGVRVRAEQTMVKGESRGGIVDLFAEMTRVSSAGRIIKERRIENGLRTKRVGGDSMLVWVYRASVDVAVNEEEPDPSFSVSAATNRRYFMEGEKLEISVSSPRDCYVTIFNVLANDSVIMLAPSKYIGRRFIQANKEMRLPPEGISFVLTLPPGAGQETVEGVLVVATKKEIPPPQFMTAAQGEFGSAPAGTGSLIDLNRWIVSISPAERAEAFVSYGIRRNPKQER